MDTVNAHKNKPFCYQGVARASRPWKTMGKMSMLRPFQIQIVSDEKNVTFILLGALRNFYY
jgi:hypothetical protein